MGQIFRGLIRPFSCDKHFLSCLGANAHTFSPGKITSEGHDEKHEIETRSKIEVLIVVNAYRDGVGQDPEEPGLQFFPGHQSLGDEAMPPPRLRQAGLPSQQMNQNTEQMRPYRPLGNSRADHADYYDEHPRQDVPGMGYCQLPRCFDFLQ